LACHWVEQLDVASKHSSQWPQGRQSKLSNYAMHNYLIVLLAFLKAIWFSKQAQQQFFSEESVSKQVLGAYSYLIN